MQNMTNLPTYETPSQIKMLRDECESALYAGGRSLNAIWYNSGLNHDEKFLLDFFGSECDFKGNFRDWIKVKLDVLAERKGFKKTESVARIIQSAIQKGYLEKRATYDKNGRKSENEYRLTSKLFDEYAEWLFRNCKELKKTVSSFDWKRSGRYELTSSVVEIETPLRGGTETPLRGGTETPLRGGTETPLRGGTETPLRGGTETPLRGGTFTPSSSPSFPPLKELLWCSPNDTDPVKEIEISDHVKKVLQLRGKTQIHHLEEVIVDLCQEVEAKLLPADTKYKSYEITQDFVVDLIDKIGADEFKSWIDWIPSLCYANIKLQKGDQAWEKRLRSALSLYKSRSKERSAAQL
jgi:hypothetical protein